MVTIGFPCAEESSQPCPRGLLGSCRCACARCCVCVGSRESVAFVSSLPSTGVSWLCVRAVWCGGGAFSAVRGVRIVRIASFAPRFFVFWNPRRLALLRLRSSSVSRCCCRRCCCTLLARICHWEVELELGWELVFRIETVREVNTTNPAVSMDLDTEGFNVVGTVCTTCEIRQIELNLVPAVVKPHRHGADKRLDPRHGLVV